MYRLAMVKLSLEKLLIQTLSLLSAQEAKALNILWTETRECLLAEQEYRAEQKTFSH